MSLPHDMDVVAIAQPGGPGVLDLRRRPVPSPGHGQILIRVAYTGVNRPDVLQRQGAYAPPPGASDLPGLECAGHVAAVGPGVSEWEVGDAVCALLPGGGYAEYAVAPLGQTLPVPGLDDHVDPSDGEVGPAGEPRRAVVLGLDRASSPIVPRYAFDDLVASPHMGGAWSERRQRLDRALVHRSSVDAGAEVPDRVERAALLAGALDRLDRRCDAGKAGEHHDAHPWKCSPQFLHTAEAGTAAQLQVDHCIVWLPCCQQPGKRVLAGGMHHLISAPLERFLQGPRKGGVVLHQHQQRCLHVAGTEMLDMP